MKTYFKFFMSMAAAVVALSSCQKEIESKDAPAKEKGVLSITVKATQDALKSEAGTKTYIDGTSIFWGTGEYMKIGVFDGEGTAWGTSNNESADLWNGQQKALFEFSITPKTESGTYTYYGMYPASAAATSSNNEPASYKVNLPASQKATASSYDPKAYILVAQPDGGHDAVMTDWDAAFRRATALNKITLKNLPEDIKRVSITAPENVKLAGGRHINLTTGQSDDIYSGVNKIDVKFDAPQATGSDVVVWFTSWDAEIPVDANLTIVAYSTAHTFTRTLTVANKSITFKEGCLNTLNVNMSSADQGDNTELEPGDYVVLAKDGTKYYALKAEKEEGKERLLSVAYEGALDSYTGDADIVWTLSKSGDSFIFENSSKYLGYKGSGNESYWLEAGESWTETNYLLDVTAQEGTEKAGLYYVTLSSSSNTSRYLSKNSSSAFFAFYGNTGQKADIVFVPATVDTRSDVTLAFEDAVVNLTTSDYDQFGQEDVTATPDVEAVLNHLSWSYTDPDGIIDDFDNGSLKLNGNTGTATVTVSFAGDENYRPAEASYTINVTDGGIPTVSYEKVTSAPADWSGDYLLVCENRGEALSSISTTSTKYGIGAPVTISNDAIESSATVDAYKIVIAAATGKGSGYTLKFGDDYLFWSSGNSLATNATESDNTRWTITEGATAGNWIIANVSDPAREIWYNTGSPRFACYTGKSESSSYAAIQLYKYASAPDTREEAGMSWNAEAATATVNTGNLLSFTAPELNAGHASLVTYESSDETIATINASGEVTVTALDGEHNTVKEGSTTIKAVFAGDESYKPQTVSYTLTVADGRAQVPTPSFDTPEGEVTAGTDVAFECELDEVNFHYTVNGTTPTVDSPIGTSVVIDEPTTVKIIAEKLGYKPSEVASATYTISGVQPHDGSLEYPYTASEARDLALNGDTGTYYITGTVTKVQNQFSAGYGTANFWIDENGVAEDVFEGYKIKYFDDVAWVEGNRLMEVGDVVIINGTLTVYKTSIAETSSGHLVSINGTTKGLHAGSLTATPDNDNKQITVTWGAATGTDSAISYVITCGDQNFNASAAGSHTFTMADYGSYDVSVVATAADAFSATATTTAILSDPSSSTPNPETITFADLGLTNGVQYPDPFDGGNFTITFGGGANDGKYYTTGAGIRTYGGGTITIAANGYNIKSVAFVWDGSNKPTSDVANPTGYSSNTSIWTGSASSVVLTRPSGSGHWRLKSVTVTYN